MSVNSTALKRKRRVYKNGCANPLFVKWIEEWRDDARDRGVNSHYSYTKALNSLKKYPLPLASGQEAKVLDHVGEKLAKMLDKKLAEHRTDQVTGSSTSPLKNKGSATCNFNTDASSPKRKETTSATGGSCRVSSPHKSKKIDKRTVSETVIPSMETKGTKPLSKKKVAGKKHQSSSHEYVPVFRSGPYAILVALYEAEEKPSWRGYMSKSQLITEAQPYCDTSFTVADAGSYYTAWSSASSLVAKGLMIRKGHPPRFSLSDSGASIAIRLLQQTETTRNSSQHDSSTSSHGSSDQSSSEVDNKEPSTRKRHSYGSSSESLSSTTKRHCSSSLLDKNIPSLKTAILPAVQAQRDYIILESEDEDDCQSELNSDITIACSIDDIDEDTVVGSQDSDSVPSEVRELCFWYINPDGKMVVNKDQAAVTINDMMSVGFLIKCDKNLLDSSHLTYNIDHKMHPEGPYVFAYLCNEDAPDVSNPPSQDLSSNSIPETPVMATSKTVSKTSSVSLASYKDQNTCRLDGSAIDPITLTDSDNDETKTVPPCKRNIVDSVNSLTPSQVAVAAARSRLSALDDTKEQVEDHPPSTLGGEAMKKGQRVKQTAVNHSNKTSKEQIPSASVGISHSSSRPETSCQSTTANQPIDLSSPQFVLRPGEFEVILCVDNSESTASRKSSTQFRGILLADLGKNGVPFDVRRLSVGDFTWIAREKASPIPGQLRLQVSREIVLEHIVERKRIDDLAGSIMDGRFSEQKFRLHNCGVRHPVYLIEEYGDSAHLKIPLRSLVQAVANTQVIDGFHVKTTADIRESVAYLTVMTRALQKHYANKTIKAYSPDNISDLNQKNRLRQGLDHNMVYSMPFRQFNEASIKNKVLTVYEMFARHLFQLPGFSADKAAAVLEIYPTPAHLRESYQNCASENERQNMLSDVRAGQCKRRLGIANSRLVCALYWSGKE